MKNQILFLGLVLIGLHASASDKFTNEIVCSMVRQPGQADMGLDVIVQDKWPDWVKRAVIVENGYAGRREIGSFNIPLQPIRDFEVNNGWTHTYQSPNFQLIMKVNSTRLGDQIAGPALVKMALPGYPPLSGQFVCKKVK